MEPEDLQPKRVAEVVITLGREDLSLLSVEELEDRIILIRQEIARCEAQIASKEGSLSDAEAILLNC